MRRNMHVALVSLGLLLGATGCNSFLTDVSNDPNNPAKATRTGGRRNNISPCPG